MAKPKPDRPPTSITLAGIPVRRESVVWLADQLDDDAAGDWLRRALANDTRILGLEVAERERILAVLDDPRKELAEPERCCFRNTSAAFATGWRKLSRDPDLIGGARCTQSS